MFKKNRNRYLSVSTGDYHEISAVRSAELTKSQGTNV